MIVTDMLIAFLNTYSKEELEESDEEIVPQPSHPEDSVERRKVIKNKILAVGRMAHVFSLLRFVTSFTILVMWDDSSMPDPTGKSVELKSMSGSAKLPYGTLVLGAEGIKDVISGFNDTYVFPFFFFPNVERSSRPGRKSEIENERLSPEPFDAQEAKAFLVALHAHSQSPPEAPSTGDLSLSTSGSIEASIEAALSSASLASSQSQSSVGGPSTPISPTSSPSKVPFRGRHG